MKPIRTERFYFAVKDGNGRFLPMTVRWWAKGAREAATEYLPAGQPQAWKACLKAGFRVVKVTVQEFRP